MEIKKTKKNPAKIISLIALAAVIVALAGYGTYAFMAKTWPFTTPRTATNTTGNTSNDGADAKTNNTASKPNASDQDKTPPQSTPPSTDNGSDSSNSPSSNDNSLTGNINYASASNDTLKVRATITQLLSSGECTLTLKNTTTGSATTYTTTVIANPSSSTCDGFDISTKNLASGDYTLSIKVTSGDKAGIITGKVSI